MTQRKEKKFEFDYYDKKICAKIPFEKKIKKKKNLKNVIFLSIFPALHSKLA